MGCNKDKLLLCKSDFDCVADIEFACDIDRMCKFIREAPDRFYGRL